jgi:(S)-citramalyl-CoA lyase
MRPEIFPKALASGADIVCMELEDGVAPKDKDAARANMLEIFAESQADDGVERVVRINGVREAFGLADVQAVLATDTPPPVLMMPKVRTPDEVIWLDNLLTERGHDTKLQVIIETNQGLEAAYDIAHCSDRLVAFLFGGVDMAAELRCENKWEPLLYARSRVVHAAASAGIDVIDVPYLDLGDPEGMAEEGRKAKELGFSGKGAIHPKQIAALNEVFTPSVEEIARAHRIIQAFEDAESGLVVLDGKLIEKPVLREVQRVLAISERIGLS